ncbi:hypothetical protein AW736_17275 [Termitidicoccus mucosus]|uniref:Haem-binding uptake Tiki superfamily ChaN domain-containing protein n=1 Tax=Termitidicoccus mucosus TaxID=1184151 RepID=A0A178IHV5_9BACT|nr:hypothetical protein AW736_17275 [Opitutaceae bacterium TSB47]
MKQSGYEPDRYVVSKFAKYDLVLLGETHEVRENCEFVASLVAPLYNAGVRTLCSEFICSCYNDRLAEIVSAESYDESSVVGLFRGGPWPTWGYQEYMDIVQAIWAFNRKLTADAEPFRIVGIDADWKQFDLLTKREAERFRIVQAREEHMAAVIEREIFSKNRKALVHIGFAHTVRHGERLAARLARKHDERIFQICLHHEMPGGGRARNFTKFIEETIAGANGAAVGFDVVGTPFGMLRDDQGLYFRMLGPNSTFDDFAEGYVFLKPMQKLTPVTWVKGFIVSDTFAEAKAVAEKLHWVEEGSCATPADLDAALAARLAKRQMTSAVIRQSR